MADIIRGTTPTIIYNMQTVAVSDIAVAFLTIKSNSSIIIQKSLEDAEVGETSLSWTLTQAETLSFEANQHAKMMLNWRLAEGTRGASNEMDICFRSNHVVEVI